LNILITGASGYIGSNLIQHLSGKGQNTIFAISREPKQTPSDIVKFIITDLNTPSWINTLPSNIDTVVYLAQSNRYREFPDGAADMMRINTQCVFELLEWSRINKIKKFIFASTGNVYQPSSNLLNETDPVNPSSFYAATKINSENLILQYRDIMTVIIFRVFSVYGKGQMKMLIPSIIEKMQNKESIILASGKGVILSPIYIEDACNIFERSIFNEIKSGIYNLAGNETISLTEIIALIEAELNLKAQTEFTSNQFTSLTASANKLYKELNYTPRVSMREGIKKIFE
jgi:nucleoside-diphosphate-sugar epimerase